MINPETLRVGIAVGSDSDIEKTMLFTGRALTKLGLRSNVDFEERILSAHRTPDEMKAYAQAAEGRGLKVLIYGAGGSAHLQGMSASDTLLPVLGVAVTESPDTMNRALGSIIGMPEGKPLAAFQGKAGAWNAGLFAARILLPYDSDLRQSYIDYETAMRDEVHFKDHWTNLLGYEQYLPFSTDLKALREAGIGADFPQELFAAELERQSHGGTNSHTSF
jgi:5-(carboxyamino)imidazole ribonucleotide mutase